MDGPRDKLIRQLQEVVCQQQEVIARQQGVIEQLQAKVTQLERQLGQQESSKGKPKGMPGNKLEVAKLPKEKIPRKKRARNFVRMRSAPTHTVEHALEECTGCGARLTHGSVKRTREVIDVPLMPATVTEHVYIERRCFSCGKRCVPKDVLGDVAVGKSRLGVGLMSLIASLREVGRLPIATIAWHLDTFHSLRLSHGAIVGVLRNVAHRAEAVVKQIHQAVQQSPWVCADETGWRQDGRNGFAWTFSTPDVRLFVRAGRDKGVVERMLGEFGGTLVSDYYAAYNAYMGPIRGAGRIYCATSTSSKSCIPRTRNWSGGRTMCMSYISEPSCMRVYRARASTRGWRRACTSSGGCSVYASPIYRTSKQWSMCCPSAYSGISRSCSSSSPILEYPATTMAPREASGTW